MLRKTVSLWVLSGLLWGCGGTESPTANTANATNSTTEPAPGLEIKHQQDETARISSGTLTTEYPAVGFLSTREGKGGYCSATLIGPRTVLTAAHCVEGEKSGWFANDFIGSAWSEARMHFNYDKNSDYDIAIVILDTAVDNVTPARLGKSPVSKGDPLTLIGYGYSNNDTSTWRPNEKYVGENTVNGVDPLWFDYKGQSNNCSGDSGGPSFVGDALVGVHAWGDGNKVCSATTGWDVRVDIYIDWITENAVDALTFSDGSQTDTPNTSPLTPAAPSAALSMTKTEFSPGEAISVNFSDLPGNKLDWVGIYASNTSDAEYLDWQYTDGAKTGTIVFEPSLDLGQYEARLFLDDSYNKIATAAFSVTLNDATIPATEPVTEPTNPTPIVDPNQPALTNGVTIKKAEFKSKKSQLKVELISTLDPNLTFEILGFGPMTSKQKKGVTTYKFKQKGADNPGSAVTVKASNGQQMTVDLKIK